MEYKKLDYICIRCNKDFQNNRCHLEKHLNRKFPCKYKKYNFDNKYLLEILKKDYYIDLYKKINDKKQCEYCLKLYSKSNIQKHIKTCKKNPNKSIETKKLNENIKEIIEESNEESIDESNEEINELKINNFSDTVYDVEIIYKLLKIINNSNFDNLFNNYIENYNIIFNIIYNNPLNKNYKIINKKKKICQIFTNNIFTNILFNDLCNYILQLLNNILNQCIVEYENKNNISLKYYKEFIYTLQNNYNKFNQKYYNNKNKNKYYDQLYIYYKSYKDLIKINQNLIINIKW
jgi:hypothetical protein